MRYEDARELIHTGDLIAVKETKGFLTPFTQFFTRSDYTHVGVCFWIGGGLWMAELNAGKNHAIPLSQLATTGFDVFDCPTDRQRTQKSIQHTLRDKINYGFIALAVIGVLSFFRLNIFVHWRRIMVCSGYCVMIYEQAGWPERSRMVSPHQLTEWLTLKFEVRSEKN